VFVKLSTQESFSICRGLRACDTRAMQRTVVHTWCARIAKTWTDTGLALQRGQRMPVHAYTGVLGGAQNTWPATHVSLCAVRR